ncbi:hypothetical protein JB92DRAFT_2838673 [Gautieria morchelliformis]|nr:hypothetical protein JB92DRAFT_2838673 [Gautieria morchelliformis]
MPLPSFPTPGTSVLMRGQWTQPQCPSTQWRRHHGLQEQQERDVRKLTLGIMGESGDGDAVRLPNMGVLRSSRVRHLLDGGTEEGQEHPPPPVYRERREEDNK